MVWDPVPVPRKAVQFVRPALAGGLGTSVPGQSVLETRDMGPGHRLWKNPLQGSAAGAAWGDTPAMQPLTVLNSGHPAVTQLHRPKPVGLHGAVAAAGCPVTDQSARFYTGIALVLFTF